MSTAARLRARWPLLMGIALIACFCAAFVARSAPLDDPFGFSHDGFNGSVFSVGARSIHADGLIASKFGAAGAEWQLTRHAYADHPPLIYAATAASQGVVDHVASASSFPRRTEFAGRLVPAVATVVAIALVFLLLLAVDVPPIAAAIAVIVGFAVPMVLVFGTMLDALVLSLAFGVLFLLAWQFAIDGRARPVWLGVTAFLACIAGWPAAILVATALVLTAAFVTRPLRVRVLVATAIGVGIAITITGLWMLWVYGGFGGIIDQFQMRTGSGTGVSVGESLRTQWRYLHQLLGPAAFLLPVAAAAAIADRRVRPVGLAASITVVVYGVGFREGSFVHTYWNYWSVLVLALGAGAVARRVAGAGRATRFVGVAVAALLVVVGFAADPIDRVNRDAVPSGAYLATLQAPADQRWLPVLASRYDGPFPQASFYLDLSQRLVSARVARRYAARHPDHWIIVRYTLVRGRDGPWARAPST